MRPDSLWEVEFKVESPMTSLPVPWEVVLEEQCTPQYRWDGETRKRKKGGQFQYTISGEGVFEDKSGVHRVPAGSGFLNKPFEPGTSYYFPEDGREPWRFIWISFYGITAELILDDLIRRYGHIYQLPINHRIITRLLNYQKCNFREQIISPVNGSRIVLDLLTTLGETKENNLFESPKSNMVRQVNEMLTGNYSVSVTEMAHRLQVSREFLSRTFKKETGQTLQDFIGDLKIENAVQLLKDTDFTVEEIAYRTGFKYFSTFTRAFKTKMGITPTSFRNKGSL